MSPATRDIDSSELRIAHQLGAFIQKSPTPFHATSELLGMFKKAGFTHLNEVDTWDLSNEGRYVITRNDSSIIAVCNPGAIKRGLRMIGAHTDSPCLKVKPNADIVTQQYWQLGVEVYGGALLHPWFDRDLSLAGRVSGRLKSGKPFSQLIDIQRPIAVIPSLAIHLARGVNDNSSINKQQHLPLILSARKPEGGLVEFLLEFCRDDAAEILDYELSCYDLQSPSIIGVDNDFIASARLDNLLSSFVGAKALIDSVETTSQCGLFISSDHEEVGSASACGAQGPFLKSVLERLSGNTATLTQAIARSLMLSCDNAHGIHPNYVEKHDENHGPLLNQGPVIKINNNQRYATDSIGSSVFQTLCEQAGVPVQKFVVRSDMGCGSTIGPITATEIGVRTVDVGAPQWAMHSIRETAGTRDCEYLLAALIEFLCTPEL